VLLNPHLLELSKFYGLVVVGQLKTKYAKLYPELSTFQLEERVIEDLENQLGLSDIEELIEFDIENQNQHD